MNVGYCHSFVLAKYLLQPMLLSWAWITIAVTMWYQWFSALGIEFASLAALIVFQKLLDPLIVATNMRLVFVSRSVCLLVSMIPPLAQKPVYLYAWLYTIFFKSLGLLEMEVIIILMNYNIDARHEILILITIFHWKERSFHFVHFYAI